MVEWWNNGMVEWWNGGMVEWWNGGMVEWWNGGVLGHRRRPTLRQSNVPIFQAKRPQANYQEKPWHMGVEEWRIDWLPPPEEIAISLEGYTGGYPVLLEIFGPDGNRVYRQQFSQPPLSLPVRLLAAGQYRYEVKRDEKNIEAGMIEL